MKEMGARRSKRIAQWLHELVGWKLDRLPIERQKMIIRQLNHLYSRAVELADPDVIVQIFGAESNNSLLGGWYLGDAAAAARLCERIRSRERT